MITLALARAPSISILESKFSIKKCPTFWPVYDIKCLPFHRKKLKSLSVLHLLKHLSFTNSLYYSDIKLQHALYKIFIPKIPHSPWARRGCISKIHYSANSKAKGFILTRRPLKSRSQISLSTRNTVQSFPRQCLLNVTGSFTIFGEKCDDGWGIKVMCQPYYKCICKVMRVVARWSIFSIKSQFRQRKAKEVPHLSDQRPGRGMKL